MKFLEFQKNRNLKGEIATGTVVNYYRATKLFCEMNDLQLSWKKIARGLPGYPGPADIKALNLVPQGMQEEE